MKNLLNKFTALSILGQTAVVLGLFFAFNIAMLLFKLFFGLTIGLLFLAFGAVFVVAIPLIVIYAIYFVLKNYRK